MEQQPAEHPGSDHELLLLEAEPSPPPTARPPWWRVLLAPGQSLFRPGAAGACLADASRPAFLLVTVLSLVAYAAIIVGLMLWHDTATQVWTAPTTVPSTLPGGYPMFGYSAELDRRSVAEVWQEWHATGIDGWFGPAEITLVLVLILGPVALFFLGWLNLPFVHRGGSVWKSYKRSVRAGTAVLSPLVLLTLACGALLVTHLHAMYGSGGIPSLEVVALLYAAVGVSLCLLAFWMSRAIRVLAPAQLDLSLSLPLRCEGCGYDLTHQPADRRCSECGLDLDASLIEERSRPGGEWARRRSPNTWLLDTFDVLLRPRRFYRALKLRTSLAPAASFATLHYLLIGCGAAAWGCAIFVIMSVKYGSPPPVGAGLILLFLTAGTCLGTLGAWFGQRLIGALVATAWLARAQLPDCRWAAKVITYETVFLWVFCAFWGLLLTSYMLFEGWVSALLGRAPWATDAEFFVLICCTVVLAAVWILRYAIAFRAIRYSNF